MDLYGRFIQTQTASLGWWVRTLTVLHFLSSQPFYNREQSAVRGIEIQGKLDLKNRSILALGG